MNRSCLAILFTTILGFVASSCDTAAPAPYYSSRRDLLGQPAPGATPPNSVNQRLSGSPPPQPNPEATSSTNSPPRQTQ